VLTTGAVRFRLKTTCVPDFSKTQSVHPVGNEYPAGLFQDETVIGRMLRFFTTEIDSVIESRR